MVLPRKSKYLIAAFALLGTLVSLVPLLIQWTSYTSAVYVFQDSYVIDKFSIVLKGLFIIITYLTFLLSFNFIDSDNYYQGEYYYLLLSSLLGALVICSSRDLLTIFIGIELASTPMFLLSGWKKGDRKSNEGAVKFFLLGVLSASLILYGFSLLYGLTGNLLFNEISKQILTRSLGSSPIVLLSAVLVIAGLGFKVSTVPFHSWAPDTYEGAPLPVTAYLSVSSKAAGFVALLLLMTTVYSTSGSNWGVILIIISGLTMTLGNLVALQQDNPVRLLAYSSIAQAGFIIAPIAISGITENYEDGIFSSVTYITIYAFMNLGAFLCVQVLTKFTGSNDIYEWAGVAKTSPFVGVLTTLFFFSLAGVPPLGGWFAKFVIFRSLLGSSETIGVVLGIIGAVNAVISLVYYARISKIIWMDEPKFEYSENQLVIENPLKVVGIVTVLITVLSGIFPGIFSNLGNIASMLLNN